jgi:hypothetical protein
VRATIAVERVLPELLEVTMPDTCRPYPSYPSDEEWTLFEKLWKAISRWCKIQVVLKGAPL